MKIGEILLGVYSKIEDKFYSAVDFLSGKGIPADSYVEFLEARGIPSFPFTVAVIAVIIALLYGLLFVSATVDLNLRIAIADNGQRSLNGVSISVVDEEGNEISIGDKVVNNNQVLKIEKLRRGMTIVLKGSKEGYEAGEARVFVKDSEASAALVLAKILEPITGKLRVVDEQTGDTIRDIVVTARWDSKEINAESDVNGVIELIGIPKGEDIVLSFAADAYELDTVTKSFESDNVYEIALLPKAVALSGDSTLIVRVYDRRTSNFLENVRIQIYDKLDGGIISDVADEDGEYSEALLKGTSVRLVVSREGYVKYDSSDRGEERTLRNDEEIWNVKLGIGGKDVSVVAVSTADLAPVFGAELALFNSLGEVIDSETTGLDGRVVFSDLNAEETYYAAGSHMNYLPARKKIIPMSVEGDVQLDLEPATSLNSATLGIFVSDMKGQAANDAALQFFEIADDKEVPLGIIPQKTDLTGYYALVLRIGTNVLVKAVKGAESGDGNITIESAKFNKLYITMEQPSNIVILNILDEEGNPIMLADVRVESATGDVLYDGSMEDGYLIFDSRGNQFIKLIVKTPEGYHYTEEVAIDSKPEATVQIGEKSASGLAPEIRFLGIVNEDEKEVKGIVPGKDYYLKFETVWPAGNYEGGVHIRVGDDSVQYVDSQDVGLYGFSAVGASYYYGRTYSPEPMPGNEGIDFQNRGRGGEASKWIELYFNKSSGTRIVKARIKANPGISAGKIEVHYRAWSIIGEVYYRTPSDALLADEEYTSQKTGLYADTEVAEIDVFDALPNCENELCATYRIVDASGSEFDIDKFKAVKGGIYALEVSIRPESDASAMLKVSTSKDAPKIAFTGSEVENFGEFIDSNNTDTSHELSEVSALANTTTKIRVYFRANDVGNSYIKTQVITADTVVSKDIYFNVYIEKQMVIETVPKDVVLGEDFSITVKDADGAGVENATLKLKKKTGELLETIIGNGEREKGLNGYYKVKNSFDLGVIVAEASAPEFKALEKEIAIGKANVLVLPEIIEIDIAKDAGGGQKTIEIENRNKEAVTSMEYELDKNPGFSDDFEVTANIPTSMAGKTKQTITIAADYKGERERDHAEADLIVRGIVEGKYITRAKARVIINYNRELEESCVEFSKSRLRAMLVDERGSSADVEFTAKNVCTVPLVLKPEVKSRMRADGEIRVDADEISLTEAGSEGATASVRISVTNELLRRYGFRKMFSFNIEYKSEQLTKTLPIDVVISSKRFMLSVPSHIELWVSQAPGEPEAFAQAPIFVRNVGEFDIENLTFSLGTGFEQDVKVEILPKYPAAILPKGQSLMPMPVVVARSNADKAQVYEGEIIVNGTVNGQGYGSGGGSSYSAYRPQGYTYGGEYYNGGLGSSYRRPDASGFGGSSTGTGYYNDSRYGTGTSYNNRYRDLGYAGGYNPYPYGYGGGYGVGDDYGLARIFVTVHVSPPSCLKIIPEFDPLEFESVKVGTGVLEQKITIYNTCGEEVRVAAIEPSMLGSNVLSIIPAGMVIQPMQKLDARVTLLKTQEMPTTMRSAFIRGFLVRSYKWIESERFNMKIELGKAAEGKGPSTEPIQIKYCGKEGFASVSFPRIASGDNCTTGYCDAEQFAEFLIKRMENAINDAKLKILHYNSEIMNTNCDKRGKAYCMFSQLEIKSETFAAYLQLDNLSPEMLEDAIAKKSSTLRNYFVRYVSGMEEYEANIAPSGFGNNIAIAGLVKGCGKYSMRINGSVVVQGSAILPDQMNIIVQFTSGRQNTKECDNKIQNAINFLPVDKSYSPSNPFESWLGQVAASEDKLEPIARDFAKGLFGNEDRFVTNPVNNRLILETGVTEGAVVEFSIEGEGNPDETKILHAMLNEAYAQTDSTKKELAAEAGRAIRELKNGAPSKESCITEDEKTLKLKPRGSIEFGIVNCPNGKLNIFASGDSCCRFSVESDLSESVKASAKLVATEGQGIEKMHIKDSKEKRELSTDEAVSLEWVGKEKVITEDEESGEMIEGEKTVNKWKRDLELCVKGDKFVVSAQNKEVALNAQSAEDSARTAEEKLVKLQVCGIHPYDLMNNIGTAKAGTYYATVGWNGEPPEVHMSQVVAAMLKQKALKEAEEKTIFGVGVSQAGQPKYEAEMKTKRLIGIGFYTAACAATTALIDGAVAVATGGTGGIKFIRDMAWNCLPGGLWGLGKEFGAGRKAIAGLKYAWSGLKQAADMGDEVKVPAQTGSDFAEFYNYPDLAAQGDADLVTRARLNGILLSNSGGILGRATAYAGREAWQGIGRVPGTALADRMSTTVADNLTKTVVKGSFDSTRFGALPPAAAPGTASYEQQLTEALEKSVKKSVQKALEKMGANGERITAETYQKIVSEVVNQPVSDDLAQLLAKPEIQQAITASEIRKIIPAAETAAFQKTAQDISKAASELAVPGEVFIDVDNAGHVTPAGRAQLTSIKNSLADEVVNGIKNKGIALSRAEEAAVRNAIIRQNISSSVSVAKTGTRIIVAQQGILNGAHANAVARKGLEALPRDIRMKLIPDELKASADDLFKQIGTKSAEKIGKEAVKLKSMPRGGAVRNVLGNPAFWRGLVTGAVAQAAGTMAWGIYWKMTDKSIAPATTIRGLEQGDGKDNDNDGFIDEEFCDGIDNDGSEGIDEDCRDVIDVKFKKFSTYKIELKEVQKKVGGETKTNRTYILSEVEPVDVPDKALRLDTCDAKYTKKGIESVIGGLAPSPTIVKLDYVSAYYENSPLTAKYAREYEVPEALLVSVMLMKSSLGWSIEADKDIDGKADYIAGCGANWPSENVVRNEPDSDVKCAAKKLNEFLAPENCKNVVKCALRMYEPDPAQKERFADEAERHYLVWKQFEVKFEDK